MKWRFLNLFNLTARCPRFLPTIMVRVFFERQFIMSKSLLFALLVASASTLSAGVAFACGGRCASAGSYAAPSCAAPASTVVPSNGAPADPHAGMKMSKSNTSSSYQSFSYEPGSAPVMSSPVQNNGRAYRSYSQPSNSFF